MPHHSLALPPKAPEVEHWRDEPFALLPVALYSIVDLSDSDLVELQDVCESKCESNRGECVRPPTKWKFVGDNLSAVFRYHVELAESREFDPTHFIVAVHTNWNSEGVLLITLDSDEEECTTDSFWIKAEDAGQAYVDVLIGKFEWPEQKQKLAIKG
ncbi:uncharacterized protein K452DRAFT_157731 [Aplosporella prunicola CBS 121167]|uniref:Uncharacterized protein n=1 Tax=Aplosporella prunicola CBS 121167 TaxID=1176127 RepID=A0A6A6AXA4_9PEZI|nr:uncharacterized protein K452DRAFT_157731 [Aplosporella prunicola CBS 121167]KAF2135888.1 hypothetical protein K452DRAFT_157731 [Aplosporella prunicola CBS 121167]